MFLDVFLSQEKLFQLERETFVQAADAAHRGKAAKHFGVAARDDECDDLVAGSEILDKRCSLGDKSLDFSELHGTSLLQRHIFWILYRNFAQRSRKLLFLSRERLKVGRLEACCSLRLCLDVLKVQLFAKAVDFAQ